MHPPPSIYRYKLSLSGASILISKSAELFTSALASHREIERDAHRVRGALELLELSLLCTKCMHPSTFHI